MVENIFLSSITQLGYILNIIVIPLATIIVGRKLVKEKRTTGRYNAIRGLIFTIFFSFSILVILEFFVNSPVFNLPLLIELFGDGFESFGLNTLIIGIIASLGLTMVATANRWEFLYYTSLFIFGGMILLYIFTGFEALLTPYIYFAGGASIVFLYLTGFRVKDNGALALAIFFTIAFGTVIFDNPMITPFGVIIYDIFILVFSLGLFKPFKKEVMA
jgi:hypothetical protein